MVISTLIGVISMYKYSYPNSNPTYYTSHDPLRNHPKRNLAEMSGRSSQQRFRVKGLQD